MTDHDPSFTARIETAMEQQGLTMKALSQKAGYSDNYVREILKRGKVPSIAAFLKIATALGVSPVWLLLGDNRLDGDAAPVTQVPLVSSVSAGNLKKKEGVRPSEIERWIPVADLQAGDWIALTVEGDSMNRVAPDGAIIIVNRADDTLLDGRFYVFTLETGEATFKRFRRGDRPLLQPYSLNPDHLSIPVMDDEVYVVGRVKRVIIDL